jgi:hypothetical protein
LWRHTLIEDGKLLEKYDLQLALRPRSPSVSTGVNAVLMPVVDTLDTSDIVDNIEYNSDLGIGVNVSTEYGVVNGIYLFNDFREDKEDLSIKYQ